jgi:hypothetical protein
MIRASLSLLMIFLLCTTSEVVAQEKKSFLFFEIPEEKQPLGQCRIYWWNDDLTDGFETEVEIAEGAQSVYGIALRPEVLKEDVLSYGLKCEFNGQTKPIFITGGRTITEREVNRLSSERKVFVSDIQDARKSKESLALETRIARSQLLSLIPTDDIINLRQEIERLTQDTAMLVAEKKVLQAALENLDFKKTESDVFFASEKLLQQYLEEQRPKPKQPVKKSKG